MKTRKKTRKMIGCMLAAMLFFTMGPSVTSAQVTFDDVDPSSAHYDSIMELAEGGTFYGNNGQFKPYQPMTRGQVAAVLTRTLLLEVPNDPGAAAFLYDDVSYNNEHLSEITTVIAYDIFRGNHHKFRPHQSMTREQMATVMVKAFQLEGLRTDNYEEVTLHDQAISPIHRDNVQIIANHGITDQTDDFRAQDSVQRDQFASFLTRAFYAVQEYRH